jgi:anti-sigma B factor antagonist
MRLVTTESGGGTHIAVSGEIDISSADRFAAAIDAQLPSGPVVLDLSAVSFIDSSGIRALVRLLRDPAEHSRELSIRPEFSDAVRMVFEVAGVLDVLPLISGPEPTDA